MALEVMNPSGNAGETINMGSVPIRNIPWSRKWHFTPIFLPGKFHAPRSLAGYSPRRHRESRHNWATEHYLTLKQLNKWKYLWVFITEYQASLLLGAGGKESACQSRRHKRCGFDPRVGKILWRRKWHFTPIFLPGEFHGQKNLVAYSPWGLKESDKLRLNTV